MVQTGEEAQTQLLRQIAKQDRQALADFYDQTAATLFSVAARILGDPHEAEEVIQDVFVQIWDKASLFDPAVGVPLHWALTITRRRAIDRLRARQRRSRLIDQIQQMAPEPIIDFASAQSSLTEDEVAAVRGALTALPVEQRQAIEMAFFGGLTHQAIAETLSEPLGTIKARIRRGMLSLRESLQAYV
jgi:RNA polymerase sigma-70 factor (ECF subfamily)